MRKEHKKVVYPTVGVVVALLFFLATYLYLFESKDYGVMFFYGAFFVFIGFCLGVLCYMFLYGVNHQLIGAGISLGIAVFLSTIGWSLGDACNLVDATSLCSVYYTLLAFFYLITLLLTVLFLVEEIHFRIISRGP